MSKFTKFVSDPELFLLDMVKKNGNLFIESDVFGLRKKLIKYEQERLIRLQGLDASDFKPKTFLIGFSPWKQFMASSFPDREMVFLDKNITQNDFKKKWADQILANENCNFMVWGFKVPKFIINFAEENNIPVLYIEDGFIRSIELGATKAPPFSLSIDRQTPYFNAQKPSDLEDLFSTLQFSEEELARARALIDLLVKTGISKYNQSRPVDIESIYGPKNRKRILVIGQVEDDASIAYGSAHKYTNNDLVTIAYLENPDAQVIYKPHPDVLHQKRPMLSNPKDVEHICQVLVEDIPLAQSFETIDHVYTITSQAGFEALMRGIKVTTLGCPFYSGWGLTDDRQENSRRQRQLSLEQMVATVYFHYLKFIDPIYKKSITAEEAVERLVQLRGVMVRKAEHSLIGLAPQQGEVKKPNTFLVGFGPWREFVRCAFPERQMHVIDKNITFEEFNNKWEEVILNDSDCNIMVWGFKFPKFLTRFAQKNNIPLLYIEDGFIRSIGLGASKAPPFSITVDSQTPYFNAQIPSDLEDLFSTLQFSEEELERARALIDLFVTTGISKYNQSKRVDLDAIYGEKTKKRVLVIGQVEDDASIAYGATYKYTNNDLVTIAYLENPDAQIIYKPHPDVLHQTRPMLSNPKEVEHICQVLVDDIPLAQSFETIDHVYTITSQAGFEALMRGIKVTTLGCPFYSGWGLTDDRQENLRRQRQLTLEQMVAAVYFHYLKFIDPLYKKAITPEQAIERLVQLRDVKARQDESVLLAENQIDLTQQVIKEKAWVIGFQSDEYRYLDTLFNHYDLRKILKHTDTFGFYSKWINVLSNSHINKVIVNEREVSNEVLDYFISNNYQVIYHTYSPLHALLNRHDIKAFMTNDRIPYESPCIMSLLEQTIITLQGEENDLSYTSEILEKISINKLNNFDEVYAGKHLLIWDNATGSNVNHYTLNEVLSILSKKISLLDLIVLKETHDVIDVDLEVDTILNIHDLDEAHLNKMLSSVDSVSTLSSIYGFHALLSGTHVNTFGYSFYAGWGLTTDHIEMQKNRSEISLQTLLAACIENTNLFSQETNSIMGDKVNILVELL